MDLSLAALLAFARHTVSDPRAAARRVMALPLSIQDRWAALLLTVVCSTILFHIELALMPADVVTAMLGASPLRTGLIQTLTMVAVTGLTWRLGRARGGTGSLADAVILMAWLQVLLLFVQAAQVVALVILPPLASLLGFAGIGLFFWLFTHFVAEMHGFKSLMATFAGIAGTILALAFLVALATGGTAPQG